MRSSSFIFKVSVILLASLIGSTQKSFANEKLVLGLKGNIGAGSSTGLNIGSEFGFQYAIGAQLCYTLLPLVAVESGLQHYQTGWVSSLSLTNEMGEFTGTRVVSYKFSYLTVPLYLRLQLKGLYVAGGVNFGIHTATNYSGYPDGPPAYILMEGEGDVNPVNLELHFGLGYRFMFLHRAGLFFELGYNRQLLGLYENVPEFNLFNFNLGAGVCVSLIND